METQKQESAPGRIWMQQLVPLMHTPLWVCRADGGLTARYGGQSLGNDAPIFRNAFRRSLLIQGNRKKPMLAKRLSANRRKENEKRINRKENRNDTNL